MSFCLPPLKAAEAEVVEAEGKAWRQFTAQLFVKRAVNFDI
jgi:hypothetical protein